MKQFIGISNNIQVIINVSLEALFHNGNFKYCCDFEREGSPWLALHLPRCWQWTCEAVVVCYYWKLWKVHDVTRGLVKQGFGCASVGHRVRAWRCTWSLAASSLPLFCCSVSSPDALCSCALQTTSSMMIPAAHGLHPGKLWGKLSLPFFKLWVLALVSESWKAG